MIDPDKTLAEIRRLLDQDVGDHDTEVANLLCALDTYLSTGGRLPESWGLAHRPTKAVGQAGRRPIEVPADEPEPLGGPVPGLNGSHPPGDDHA